MRRCYGGMNHRSVTGGLQLSAKYIREMATMSPKQRCRAQSSSESVLHPPESQFVVFFHLRLHDTRCWDIAFRVATFLLGVGECST